MYLVTQEKLVISQRIYAGFTLVPTKVQHGSTLGVKQFPN